MKDRFELMLKDTKTGKEKLIEKMSDDDWHDEDGQMYDTIDLETASTHIKEHMEHFGDL